MAFNSSWPFDLFGNNETSNVKLVLTKLLSCQKYEDMLLKFRMGNFFDK